VGKYRHLSYTFIAYAGYRSIMQHPLGIRASLDPLPNLEMVISTAREPPGKSKRSKAQSWTVVHHALTEALEAASGAVTQVPYAFCAATLVKYCNYIRKLHSERQAQVESDKAGLCGN